MKGSMTVEVAYIMPVVFLVFIMTILATFYYHDKCILHGIAYEAGMIGSRNYESSEAMDTEELEVIIVENNRNKLILFESFSIDMTTEEDWLIVDVYAQTDRFTISTSRSVPLVDQEKTIRDINKLGTIISG